MRKFLSVTSFAVAALLAVALPVSADEYHGGNGGGQSGGQGSGDPMYNWSLSGLDHGSGTLTTTDIGGYVAITGFSGTIDGYTVTLDGTSNEGGYNISPDGFFAYNNILYPDQNSPTNCYTGGPGGGYLDTCGVLVTFTKDGHTYEGNIFLNTGGPNGYAFLFCYPGDPQCYEGNSTGDSFTIPEPASLALLGTGLVAAAGAMRRRRRNKKA